MLQISLHQEKHFLWEIKSVLVGKSYLKKTEAINEFISSIPRKVLSNDIDKTLRSKKFSSGYGISLKKWIMSKKNYLHFCRQIHVKDH